MTFQTNCLSEGDLMALGQVAGQDPETLRAEIRDQPWLLPQLLSRPEALDAITDPTSDLDDVVSPFLLFAVISHRAASELASATHVNDWFGPRSRIPVFDVAPLHEFARDSGRLLFLAGLLASFAGPRAAPVPVDSLDLGSLAIWHDAVGDDDRPVLLRQLGDLALFLAGVFPDRTGPCPLSIEDAGRLGQTLDLTPDEIVALVRSESPSPGIDALESLGERWYRAAIHESSHGSQPVLADVAARFRAARRFLNHLVDTYVFPSAGGLGVASA